MSAPAPARPSRPPPRDRAGVVPRTWPRVLAVVLAGAAGFTLVVADRRGFPLGLRFVFWAVLALGIPAATAGDWLGRPGPLLFYELRRCARRDRYVLCRAAYAAVLLIILCWCYLAWFRRVGDGPLAVLLGEWSVPASEVSKFAGNFFIAFLGAQLGAVLVLTPVYVGGAIAEEKQRRSLEFLLATDLSNAEIVLSKLAARLVNLGLLVLAGLPVLALTELWGGVDPFRLAVGFAATVLTMASVGSLSVLNSVFARHPLDAVLRTYGQLALFLTAGACLPCLIGGHPLLLLVSLSEGGSQNIMAGLGMYAVVHLAAASLLLLAAVQQLRAAAVSADLRPRAAPAAPPARPRPPLPPVGEDALLWKELRAEPRLGDPRMHRLLGPFFLGVGGLAVLGLILLSPSYGGPRAEMLERINLWVRGTGTSLAALLVVLTGFSAAGSVSRERERQTLDSLRTVPEGSDHILLAKWLGGFLSAWQGWWCLGLVWGFGLLTGGLNVLALPLLLLAFAVYTAFAASLGLYCSTACRSTARATAATLVVLLALGVGPLLACGWGDPFLPSRPAGVAGCLAWWGATGLAPLWALAFRYDELWGVNPWGFLDRVFTALVELACYAAAAWALWRGALAYFRAEAGPAPRRDLPPEAGGSASRR